MRRTVSVIVLALSHTNIFHLTLRKSYDGDSCNADVKLYVPNLNLKGKTIFERFSPLYSVKVT